MQRLILVCVAVQLAAAVGGTLRVLRTHSRSSALRAAPLSVRRQASRLARRGDVPDGPLRPVVVETLRQRAEAVWLSVMVCCALVTQLLLGSRFGLTAFTLVAAAVTAASALFIAVVSRRARRVLRSVDGD